MVDTTPARQRRRSPFRRKVRQDPAFHALGEHGQWAYLMLMDQPRQRGAHTLTLTPRRWSNYRADATVQDVEIALMELQAAGYISIDWEWQEITFLPSTRAVPLRRRHIPAAIRKAVFDRDGHACVHCGSTNRLSLDHVVRYRHGGQDTVNNLRVLCTPCNLERG